MLQVPFDHEALDAALVDADVDVLLVTSKHNVQYLTGGYRFFWFDYMDGVGVSRYLPILSYTPGRLEEALYIGNALEPNQLAHEPIWVPRTKLDTWGIDDAVDRWLDSHQPGSTTGLRVGIEENFLPTRAAERLRGTGMELVAADALLDRLRAVKSAWELELIERASDLIVDSMAATFDRIVPGMTKREVVATLREQEVQRGLIFEYALINTGTSLNRAASDEVLREGDIICLDSGGNYRGYIGDLARMAVVGEADAELESLLADVDDVQQAARSAIVPGATGAEVFVAAERVLSAQEHAEHTVFVAHGMGLVSHEPPHLTSTGPVPYPATDADRPLVPGMVLSIETTLAHPRRGFVKLEDTVLVTEDGFRAVGDGLRGWTRCGRAAESDD